MFIALLSFSGSIASKGKVSVRTECLFLNDEPCTIRATLIDMNPVELKYYLLMISLR